MIQNPKNLERTGEQRRQQSRSQVGPKNTDSRQKKKGFVRFENKTDVGLAASCYFSELIAVIDQIIRCSTGSRNSRQHASPSCAERRCSERRVALISIRPVINTEERVGRTADARLQMNYSFYVLPKPKTQNKNTHCCAVNKTFKVGRPLEPDSSVLFMPDRRTENLNKEHLDE